MKQTFRALLLALIAFVAVRAQSQPGPDRMAPPTHSNDRRGHHFGKT